MASYEKEQLIDIEKRQLSCLDKLNHLKNAEAIFDNKKKIFEIITNYQKETEKAIKNLSVNDKNEKLILTLKTSYESFIKKILQRG